jgi:hypothetical protein
MSNLILMLWACQTSTNRNVDMQKHFAVMDSCTGIRNEQRSTLQPRCDHSKKAPRPRKLKNSTQNEAQPAYALTNDIKIWIQHYIYQLMLTHGGASRCASHNQHWCKITLRALLIPPAAFSFFPPFLSYISQPTLACHGRMQHFHTRGLHQQL